MGRRDPGPGHGPDACRCPHRHAGLRAGRPHRDGRLAGRRWAGGGVADGHEHLAARVRRERQPAPRPPAVRGRDDRRDRVHGWRGCWAREPDGVSGSRAPPAGRGGGGVPVVGEPLLPGARGRGAPRDAARRRWPHRGWPGGETLAQWDPGLRPARAGQHPHRLRVRARPLDGVAGAAALAAAGRRRPGGAGERRPRRDPRLPRHARPTSAPRRPRSRPARRSPRSSSSAAAPSSRPGRSGSCSPATTSAARSPRACRSRC